MLWVKVESEEVGLQVPAEDWEGVCRPKCTGEFVPEFGSQKGEEPWACRALSRMF